MKELLDLVNQISGYFDLSKPISARQPLPETVSVVEEGNIGTVREPSKEKIFIRDLDLTERRPPSKPKRRWWEQPLVYLGLLVGVLFSELVEDFRSGQPINFNTRVILCSIGVSFLLFPDLFKRLNAKTDSPLFVRCCISVQHGFFWQVILGTLNRANT